MDPATSRARVAAAREHLSHNLRRHSCFDLLPNSFKLCVFDVTLPVPKALSALVANNLHAVPLWDSKGESFAGMLTVTDFAQLMRYQHSLRTAPEEALEEIKNMDVLRLKEILKSLRVIPELFYSVHPLQTLLHASQIMITNSVNRLPLVDREDGFDCIVGLLTQYRLLKYIATNFNDDKLEAVTLADMRIGTFVPDISTVTFDTPVGQVLELFTKRGISAVPIVDENFEVLDIFEKYDILSWAKNTSLAADWSTPVGHAVGYRSSYDNLRVHMCVLSDTLYSLLATLGTNKVHRFVVVDEMDRPADGATPAQAGPESRRGMKPGEQLPDVQGRTVRRLRGIVTLSDLLKWIVREQ